LDGAMRCSLAVFAWRIACHWSRSSEKERV